MSQRGFTLIELLAAMAIMAFAVTAVPALLSSLPGVRLRAAADDLVGVMRDLHLQAIRGSAATGLLLDLPQRSYRLLPAGSTHALPAAVGAITFQPVSGLFPDPGARILFLPDGTSTGGTVRLTEGRRTESVRVDWLTGRALRGG